MSILLIKSGKSKGKYRVRIQPVDPLTGKKISIPSQLTKTRSKTEAKKLEKQMWHEFHLRKKKESLKLDQPFAQAFQEFVDDYHVRGNGKNRPTTIGITPQSWLKVSLVDKRLRKFEKKMSIALHISM